MRPKALIAAIVFAIGMALPVLGACSSPLPFEGETLSAGEVRANVRDGELYLRWHEEEGAEGYNVYRAATRFGDFRLVNGTPLKETHFECSDFPYSYYKITAVGKSGERDLRAPVSVFSDNTLVISPQDDQTSVQAYVDSVHDSLETGSEGQFSDKRFALVLLPGEYPNLDVKLGYYTSASGAGETPGDVKVGSIYVSTNVLSNNNSTCTFWRSAENFTVSSNARFAVSQATSLRRMHFTGDLALSHPSGWSSGGFLANSVVDGTVNPGTQQQWMSRNDEWGRWNGGGSHNYVFSGCIGDTPKDVWTESGGRVTVLEHTEKVAEKPFLIYDEVEGYTVFVPDVREDTAGVTWKEGLAFEEGKRISLDDFYIADGRDTADSLNEALSRGKHLLFPPGHYRLEKPLEVKHEGTVIMGLGYATLEITDTNAVGALKIADVGGVRVSSLLVEAGAYSENMVVVGEAGKHTSHANDPAVLSDLFLRIGGVKNVHTETDTALVIHSDDTIGDNFWLWRADHSRGVAWEDTSYEDEEGNPRTDYGNPVATGLRVTGDRVKCYALMVEHCEKYQTEWLGEDGLTVMYQSETPYRVPAQEKWMTPGGKKGYASYKVGDDVLTHRAYGIGIYLVNYSGVELDSAIEVPERAGIQMYHLVICDFTQTSESVINNVVNSHGGGVGPTSFRKLVERYPLA